jgi:hypothetical protein
MPLKDNLSFTDGWQASIKTDLSMRRSDSAGRIVARIQKSAKSPNRCGEITDFYCRFQRFRTSPGKSNDLK